MEHDSKEPPSNMEKNPYREPCHMEHDGSPILQSFWVRRDPVLAIDRNWKFMGREFRFVLYSGTILWIVLLLSMVL
jgi:hypothetical protein